MKYDAKYNNIKLMPMIIGLPNDEHVKTKHGLYLLCHYVML